MNATQNQEKPLAGANPTAIIVYDDFALAAKANSMLWKAVDRTDEAGQWNVKLWRLDLLRLSPSAEQALMEAADAGLIVIAMRRDQFLPIWLAEWLEQWARHRQIHDAALAVYGGGSGDAVSSPLTVELSQFSRRHGLTFICDVPVEAADESASFLLQLRERETTLTPALKKNFEQGQNGYQRWGLNE
jgi:hypothetical protein